MWLILWLVSMLAAFARSATGELHVVSLHIAMGGWSPGYGDGYQ